MIRLCYGDQSAVAEHRIVEAAQEWVLRSTQSWANEALWQTTRGMIGSWFAGPSLWAAAARVSTPTLVVWGGRDRLVAPRLAARTTASLRRGRLLALPEVGHVPQMEVPVTVALVICALNEERIIRQKIENSLELRYPRERLRIVVVSDGSKDRTTAIAREYAAKGVELIEQPVRRGKITNLNEVIPARAEEIIVLSDANVLYHPDAVARLVERFADPAVGCVSGKVVLQDTTPDLDQPTEQYYSVEWALQENSSIVYSMAKFEMRRLPSTTQLSTSMA